MKKNNIQVLVLVTVLLLFVSTGYAQDEIDAIRSAAERGDINAQFDLGSRYADGNGLRKDYVQAHMWLNLAASAGKESAIRLHDEIVRRMTPSQNAQADEWARKWQPVE
ncbi:MAG: hypothetical protein H7836_03465 [Magnetococcus sp. YQC-3]